MKKIICIHRDTTFRGSRYFKNTEVINDNGIEADIAVAEANESDLEDVVEEYPEDSIDGVIVRRMRLLNKIIELGLYENTPLILGGRIVLRQDKKEGWIDAVDSGRELYVFTGSIRSARTFYVPNDGNLQVVVAPMMGCSKTEAGRMDGRIRRPDEKTYDIGFFSNITINKQPHRVYETANNVAERLGETLDVWVAGPEHGDAYTDMIKDLAESDHYEHLNIEYNDFIGPFPLWEKIQDTRVIYLPAVKKGEANCYAGWETVSYDVPLVATDWAGLGEAARQARHPLTTHIRVQKLNEHEQLFPDFGKEEYPEAFEELKGILSEDIVTIDEQEAQNALINALTTDTSYTRTFEIPEQIQASTTMSALLDIVNGSLTQDNIEDQVSKHNNDGDGFIESIDKDVVKTTRGYSVIRDPIVHNSILYQKTLP